jgi:hypothetical protein
MIRGHFLLDENMPVKVFTVLRRAGYPFFPRGTSVGDIAAAVLAAVAELASKDISDKVYRIDPSGVSEEP